eukprot:TRINITY_DN7415_c0_g1_i1.p1 TRINITY_DN7415_c0_g1~~TRINITY_DN7415_c0_g1_i1.p1  ORF type:complete len:390 (-),score=102.17 TRINITY_DN7415_c0_g1_i1:84-1253(-)
MRSILTLPRRWNVRALGTARQSFASSKSYAQTPSFIADFKVNSPFDENAEPFLEGKHRKSKKFIKQQEEDVTLSNQKLQEFLQKGAGAKQLMEKKQAYLAAKRRQKPTHMVKPQKRRVKKNPEFQVPKTWEDARPGIGPYLYDDPTMIPMKPLTPSECRAILAGYEVGESLKRDDFLLVLNLVRKHPLFESFVGSRRQDVLDIKVLRPLGFGGNRQDSDLKAFFVFTSRGEKHHFSYRHCVGSPKKALERIFIETCKSVLEQNQMSKDVKKSLKHLRMGELDDGSVQEGNGKTWRIDWPKLCFQFAEENAIQVHNAKMMSKLLFRNKFGYWNFTTDDATQRFELFFKKALLTNEFLDLKFGNPNQYDGSMSYRPTSKKNSQQKPQQVDV